ncbi:hypothetical protein Dimus_012481 [Dionaea muscipula]
MSPWTGGGKSGSWSRDSIWATKETIWAVEEPPIGIWVVGDVEGSEETKELTRRRRMLWDLALILEFLSRASAPGFRYLLVVAPVAASIADLLRDFMDLFGENG